MTSGSDTGRYIVRGNDPKQLAAFIDDIGRDADIELLDTIGPAGAPHTVVVAMSQEKAKVLEQHFRNSNQLTIEPDRPLSLFGEA